VEDKKILHPFINLVTIVGRSK